jgi:putative ABC transport system permease protein
MKIFSTIAFRNVIKNWRHSLAAIISLSAGFISLVLFQGYIIDVERMYNVGYRNRAMFGDLLVENPQLHTKEGRADPEKFYLDVTQQSKLQEFLNLHRSDIKSSVRFLPATGMITNGKSSFIFLAMGYDIDAGAEMRGEIWRWDALYGKPLHVAHDPQGVLLGKSLGFLLNCLPVDPKVQLVQNRGYMPEERPLHCERDSVQLTATTESGQVNAIDLNVMGLVDGGYKDIDEKRINLSIENVQTLLNTTKIKFMSILAADRLQVPALRVDLDQFIKTQHLPVRVVPWIDHPVGDLFRQTMSLLNIFKTFIVIVIMTISGLSVFNTMVKIVKERTREIGALRSLGYTGQQVGYIFTFESLYLSFLGVSIGIVFSVLFTLWMNRSGIVYRAGILSDPVLFQIAIDSATYLKSFILLSGLSVVTSWLVTRHIVTSRIAENLTHA